MELQLVLDYLQDDDPLDFLDGISDLELMRLRDSLLELFIEVDKFMFQ